MNFFKRAWLFIFGVAGTFCLLSLALPWFGPWVEITRSMLLADWYRIIVLACLGITGIGVLVSLGRSILTPRRRTTVTVSRNGADEVTVTTAAIASQAAHIVEEGRLFFADKVTVRVGRGGKARVAIKVRPAYAVNVGEEGQRLRDELALGLSNLCGDAIRSVKLEFVQSDSQDEAPQSAAPAAGADYDYAEYDAAYEELEAPNAALVPVEEDAPEALAGEEA